MTDATVPTHSRLEHFPITFFACVMGLAGLSLVLHLAEERLGAGHGASRVAMGVTVAVFAAVLATYATKALRYPGAVAAEWHHPVKLAFFPAFSISLLLIATMLRPEAPGVARGLWMLGAAGQGVLTLAVISGWIGRRPFQPMHISPAWFIPAVGNVVVPVAGVPLGYVELSWLFFSAGLMFWVVLLTLVMNRLIFHDPLPARLLPTLVILIAPPAVGFLSWLQLNGGVLDGFARGLYYAALVFAAIVTLQVPALARVPFALSWWALSFPLAALSLSTLRYGALAGSDAHNVMGALFATLTVAAVVGLLLRTGLAIRKGDICHPE
jgi:tellurite resistance protein